MAAKLNFVNIMVYIWIFCLYILISKIIFGIFWLFYKLLGLIGLDIEPFIHYTSSYNSPIMGGPSHAYDFITAGPMMIIWAGLFFIITVVILFLMILWLMFGFFLNGVSPFKELTPIFEAILKIVPAKPVFNRYNQELTSLIKDAMKKYRSAAFENFTNEKVVENFSSNKEYIDDDFYNDIKRYYKIKDNYYAGAYKSFKHSDEASLYKTYKIIIPDMDDNKVSEVISENNIVAGRISSQSFASKKNNI